MKKALPYLLPVLFVILLRALLPAPILDDAFITAEVLRNLAAGDGMVHNIGERVFTVTTVLWTLLGGGLRAVGMDGIVALFVLGLLAEIALALIVTKLGDIVFGDPWAGSVAAMILAPSPALVATSFGGMEIALSMAAICASLLFLVKRKTGAALSIASIAVWIRIDNLLLVAFVFAWALFDRDIRLKANQLIAPSILLLIYFGGAMAYFGSPIPVSVLRKAAFPDKPWLVGAVKIAMQFFKVAIGKAEPLFFGEPPQWLVPLLLAAGIYFAVKKKIEELWPIATFAMLYFIAFTLTGKAYAALFTWYFLPPTIAVYLLCGFGLVQSIESIKSRFVRRILPLLLLVLWVAATVDYDHRKMESYRATTYARREKTYATITTWFDAHLPKNSTICSGEIGTIRFFARPDISVLDWVGLTRPLSDKRLPVNLVREEKPEAIIYWPLENQKFEDISKIYKNYSFGNMNGIMVGIRNDIADSILVHSSELPAIYETISMNREPKF
ncbi:hypothetical protein J7L01_02790 [bacterium]|nr:hypothetical protein [bacterium]